MKDTEKNQIKSYINKDEDTISELNLRLRYMIEDFDKRTNTEHDNGRSMTKTG